MAEEFELSVNITGATQWPDGDTDWIWLTTKVERVSLIMNYP
jgi:hypothetical protein